MAFKLSGISAVQLSYEDFLQEWNWCWVAQDVEAAAELGRTLLERNRELEATVRQQQAVIDDQTQEMEYLSKQNRLLRQAAESRLRLCEQLESSAAECERAKNLVQAQLDAERQRHLTMKANLDSAEERGDELQRQLDASRASEAQTRCLLRSLQQQVRQQNAESEVHPPPTSSSERTTKCAGPSEDTLTLCRLVDDLAEMEERLHATEAECVEERRKRLQLETDVAALSQENRRLQHYHREASPVSNPPSVPAPVPSLSLSEELLISSGDYNSAQWNEAWDHSGPLSLIGSSVCNKRSGDLDEEELSSGSSSSGFSDEQNIHKATQTEPGDLVITNATVSPSTTDTADYKSLFREIFAVIKQNL